MRGGVVARGIIKDGMNGKNRQLSTSREKVATDY